MITEPNSIILECRKWGFKRWVFKQNLRICEEKGRFPPFSGFSRCSSHHPEKGEEGRKRAKKADFARFPGRGARHPLSPHLIVTPPFAAAQSFLNCFSVIPVLELPNRIVSGFSQARVII